MGDVLCYPLCSLDANVLSSISPDFVKIKTSRRKNKIKLSEVGFKPTPTRVDCDLNAAP